ncbi:ATP-dependent nuclease [Clostridium paraputrificum]|uniref:ATP-dependent nuclease n=1 Tax=Clostridium paraputrificum TaxID=29363 RepID=UPI003D331061
MQSLYISRVIIKNYRNFRDVDVNLGHKQVIIGENNIGKTNFIRALQLILDPSLSDEDRNLEESDFFDGLDKPMENDEEIVIKIYISNYSNNKTILATLGDATVIEEGEEKLLITYKFFPQKKDNGGVEYQYIIFKGTDESKVFGSVDRKYLNIKVIKALRDVESELRNSRSSPIRKLLESYSIDRKELERIAEEYKKSGDKILDLDELVDLSNNINRRFSTILGNSNFDVSLKAMEVDPDRVLSSLKLLMSKRNTSDISLGLNNILYISMILQLLQDKTVPTYLSAAKYIELLTNKGSDILTEVYDKNDKNNYFLKEGIGDGKEVKIYKFMEKYQSCNKGVTLLVIEEPEAHLHPVYQRLVYKDAIRNSNSSVLLTTHSTHITSIAPISSIVHLHEKKDIGTVVHATADMFIKEDEFLDVERYLDVKRGEIYLGKAVILVEGIAEEYIIPKFAELLGKPLDEKGIIVCNINSTNFKPYVKILRSLEIPYTVITDGDFYRTKEDDKGNKSRVYHTLKESIDKDFGYLGYEIIRKLVVDLELANDEDIPSAIDEKSKLFESLGIFIGEYTFEVDMMRHCDKKKLAQKAISDLFNELTVGGEIQKRNFKDELEKGEFWKCLNKIEGNGIGKGRFAQRLFSICCREHIPQYIENAIDYIYQKVNLL